MARFDWQWPMACDFCRHPVHYIARLFYMY